MKEKTAGSGCENNFLMNSYHGFSQADLVFRTDIFLQKFPRQLHFFPNLCPGLPQSNMNIYRLFTIHHTENPCFGHDMN